MMNPIVAVGWTDPFQLIAGLWNRRALIVKSDILSLLEDGQPTDFGRDWPVMLKQLELAEVMAARKLHYAALHTLLPKTLTPWGRADAEAEEPRRWFEMALVTNPGSMMVVGTHSWSPGPGAVVELDRRMPHAAINMGDTIRVHLLFDVLDKTDA